MTDFVRYLSYLLERGLVLALAAVLIGAGVMAWSYHRWKKRNNGKFPWARATLLLMLVGYLAVVLMVTVLRTAGGRGVNLHLLLSWREAWNQFTLKLWLNIILNIALFVPLGVLLPLLWKRFEKWQWTLAVGFGLSLAIELTQLVRGNMTDVDDLLHNTLGAVLGWCLVMLVLRLLRQAPKHAVRCLALPTAVAAVFGGVFLAYGVQEFGNLEEAPEFRADMSDIEWNVQCELTGADTAAVYRVESFDKASSDAFGRCFFDRIGRELTDVYYYDNQTIMGNHSGGPFLTVNWLDRTWNVSGFEFPDAALAADEAGMRTELERLGIQVPAGAVFTYEGDGVARLEAEAILVGDQMYNGWVRRRMDSEGEYWLENNMVISTLVRNVDILSPEEALAQLQRGYSSASSWFEYYDPDVAAVRAWALEYRVDSKGFYQPVYVFTLETDRSEFDIPAVIPAIS